MLVSLKTHFSWWLKMPLTYKRTIKLKAKEIFKDNCTGKRFIDKDYSEGIIGTIFGKDAQDVWNEIEYYANDYHERLAMKNMKIIGEITKPFFDSVKD